MPKIRKIVQEWDDENNMKADVWGTKDRTSKNQ